MIFRLITRIIYLLKNDSDLEDIAEVKEVDDLDGYDDFISQYPSIGIGRGQGEKIFYRGDTRQVQHVFTPLDIRVYTRHESSPEAARKALDILTWKVVNALRKNPRLVFDEFDPEYYLIDSEVNNISYGSKKHDKIFDEYATIELSTQRPEIEPAGDEEYTDIIKTMLSVHWTGGGPGQGVETIESA